MVELIKELNLTHAELDAINASEYIEKEQKEKEGSLVPFYTINEEGLEEDLDDADVVVDKHGKNVRPVKWLRDEIDSWSQETRKDKEEVIERGKATGFSEETIESALENLDNDGEIYEPTPGKVQRL